MTPRIFVYKIVVDNGGAPCIADGLLSLAICKPKIRTSAKKGDVIFGFGVNPPPMSNRLIYLAIITEAPLLKGSYYDNPDYRTRSDCIYERAASGQMVRSEKARFHTDSDHRPRDIGSWPGYQKATVLLSREFRYFGKKGTADYVEGFPLIARLVKGMKQGHRVNHSEALRKQVWALQAEIWSNYPAKMVIGPATDPKNSRPCNSDCPSVTVSR